MSAPAFDRKLPGLSRALDNSAMSALLSTALRRESRPVLLSQVRSELLKYVPGKRSVVAYHLSSPLAEWNGRRIFGKLYRKERGQALFQTLRALWQTAERQRSEFAMPEPLAYVAELGMVLQDAAPGRALANLSHPDELFAAMQRAAKNLAALHGLPATVGAPKVFQDHLHKYCHPGPETLAEAHPELKPLVHDLIAMMHADESLRTAESCPVHGDLNLAQIFITAQGAVFIDFDGFCRSHAALDVGNFLVNLNAHFGEHSGELRHGFLEAYLAATPTHALSGLSTYQAFAYLRRAMIAFRLQNAAERLALVRKLLEAGLALMHAKE